MIGLGLAAALPAAAQAREGLKVMSFNVRLPLASDGPNRWEARQDLFVETIRRADPDIIGTQELWKIQGDHLIAKLPRYNWFGIDRRGGHADEHMGVFYRRDRLKLIEMGNFWLSETPEVPGSNSWGESLPRMATFGLFETIPGGKRFWFFNTHFAHRAEDESARTKAAELIAARIAKLPGDLPVVLTGDFNTVPDSGAHRALTAGLSDAWSAAAVQRGPEGTFHGFTGKPERRIDWVLARGLTAGRVETVTFGRRGRYPSDHFPVVVDYRWP
ncbi:endonuclease/exonuclease/phosphatase family protein [Sphingomonas sp. BT-65]|uniref:endonuclease/exonuclease/phosphatase family protein n=1 Tax=Sphingomonas sp. BT-65 TaxID=2989821 RepID=UPI0022365385|nr:endonuclease/exonuclease/phosphatase family protein [Sphingomonas sp. BT-65]MCW4463256.1 endonuclease/exonuclease/phosphatase family protein [Sphingomonas sp. BT-65]